MMGWALVDESGAELGGRGSTHVQRCREWVEMAPPAAARATACAGMLFMSLSAAAWLQQPMTPPVFAKRRLDALGG